MMQSDSPEPRETFDAILQKTNFDLCDALFCQIGDRVGDLVYDESLSEQEQLVSTVWWAFGIIGNGGLERLFSGVIEEDPGYARLYEYHRILNLPNACEALRQAFALFPGGVVPTSEPEIYEAYIGATDFEERWRLSCLYFDDAGTDDDSPLVVNLASYIRENADWFREVGDY